MASSPFFALFIALLVSCIILPQNAAASPLSHPSQKHATFVPELERVKTFSTTTSSLPLQPQHTLPAPSPTSTTLSTFTTSRRPMIIIPPKRSATASPTAENPVWFKRDTGTPFNPPLPTASRACHIDPHQPHCVAYLKSVTDYQSLYTPPASAPTPFPCNVRDSLTPRCREYLHSLEAADSASSAAAQASEAAVAKTVKLSKRLGCHGDCDLDGIIGPIEDETRCDKKACYYLDKKCADALPKDWSKWQCWKRYDGKTDWNKEGWGWKRQLVDPVTTDHFGEGGRSEEVIVGGKAVRDVDDVEAKKGDWKKPPEWEYVERVNEEILEWEEVGGKVDGGL